MVQVVVLGFLALSQSPALAGQASTVSTASQDVTSQGNSDVIAHIDCLSTSYQAVVRQYVPAQKLSGITAYLRNLSAEDCFLDLMGMVVQSREGMAFIFSKLDAEPSGGTRTLLLKVLDNQAQGLAYTIAPLPSDSQIRVLDTHASSDPDVDASLEALAVLRELHIAAEARLLQKREALTPPNEPAAARALDETRLQYYSWFSRVRLPAFASSPPSIFSVVPSSRAIRVLAFGDFGTGSDGQIKAAAAMRAYSSKHPFNYGITLGDNFYGAADRSRVNSPYSLRWQSEWEELYGAMGIKVYPVFGNNDYYDPDSPAAELAYTQRSKTWDFPAPYYTFTAGSAQFFAIDTMRVSADELEWLDRELQKSTARWKIVYGHYPIYAANYAAAPEGTGETKELIEKLLPILEKNHVQIYLNGHVHNMQEVRTDSPVHFFTSGGGGAGLGSPNPTYKNTVFKDFAFGFTVLEIDDFHVDVIFVDADGKEVYRSHLTQ